MVLWLLCPLTEYSALRYMAHLFTSSMPLFKCHLFTVSEKNAFYPVFKKTNFLLFSASIFFLRNCHFMICYIILLICIIYSLFSLYENLSPIVTGIFTCLGKTRGRWRGEIVVVATGNVCLSSVYNFRVN